jgi:hypothetical protein
VFVNRCRRNRKGDEVMVDRRRKGGNGRGVGKDRQTVAGKPPAGAVAAARPADVPRIWAYTPSGHWHLVEDPVPEGCGEVGRLLQQAGWRHVTCLGRESSRVSVDLWRQVTSGEYLAWLGVEDEGGHVWLADLPSLLAFMGLVLPMVAIVAALEAADERDDERRRRGA